MAKIPDYRPKPINPITLLRKRQYELKRFDNLREEVKMIDDCIWYLTRMGWDKHLKVEVDDDGEKAKVR